MSSSSDECILPHRPYSAPTYSLFSVSQTSSTVGSFGKNEQLCGWSLNTTPSSHAEPPQPKRAAKKQRGLRTTDKPSTKHGKWQNPNVGMCNNKSQIDFEYTFQHHTDTSQYMSVYRRTKLAKIYDMFSDDIEEMLNQRQPEICADLAPAAPVGNNSRRITGGGSSIYISSPVEQEEYPMTYRVENRRRNKDRNISTTKERQMKINGGKMSYSREDLRILKDQHSVKQVPKCDAIVFSQGQQTISQHRQQHNYHALRRRLTPSRHDNNNKSQSNINSQELYQHTIQCKKLAELSIQKATRYSHQQKFLNINNGNIQFSASSWMPQDALLPREKIKLRSAEERRRRCIIQQQPQSSLKKASGIKGGGGGGEGERGYSQIIKRVLEHYDPSRNQVRTRMPPSSQQQQHHPGGGLSAKGLVATT